MLSNPQNESKPTRHSRSQSLEVDVTVEKTQPIPKICPASLLLWSLWPIPGKGRGWDCRGSTQPSLMGTCALVWSPFHVFWKALLPAKIFHSWTQPKGEFILESLSQIFLQLESEAGEIKVAAYPHMKWCPQSTTIVVAPRVIWSQSPQIQGQGLHERW